MEKEEERDAMRIGIITLPLRMNYGGLLQAYALQTTLERMGHQVVVIDKSWRIKLPVWKWPYSYPKRLVKKYLLGGKERIFFEQYANNAYPVTARHTVSFIDTYIHRLEVEKLSRLRESDFDAFVVGSDQIWRPIYCCDKIEESYLDFARDWNIKRIAYAASFGTDKWEYTAGETRRCGELLRQFDAVSVRESSGVRLCSEHFGVEARQVLDPTLLLNVADYVQLVEKACVSASNGNMMVYILDETPEKQELVSRLAADRGVVAFRGNSRVEDWDAPLEERIQPPVERWLRGFMDAELVVTDSFHACVFSIIFNKPFVVVGNKDRGLARIHSLLGIFGLERCLYGGSGSLIVEDICWEDVNLRWEAWRKHSVEVLQ